MDAPYDAPSEPSAANHDSGEKCATSSPMQHVTTPAQPNIALEQRSKALFPYKGGDAPTPRAPKPSALDVKSSLMTAVQPRLRNKSITALPLVRKS
jgi:hypothetical protein